MGEVRGGSTLFIPPPLAGEGGERERAGWGCGRSDADPTPIALRAIDPPLSGEG
jgi:hypothetical protein